MTRASFGEEPGVTDWNENKIMRVDLFVFATDGTCYKHIEEAANDNEPPLSNKEDDSYTTLTTNELTYGDVHDGDYTYYMVANCEQLADVEKPSLTNLQEMMINNLSITYNTTQELFVMDGKGTVTSTGESTTLTFNLERAAAKIRLTVLAKDKTTNVTSQCSFRFYNYIQKKAWVLAREEATASDGTSLTAEEVNAFYDLVTNETDITRQSMSALTPYSSNDLLKSNDNKVVFYSYPNDWFDESKAYLGTDGNWTIDDYTTTNPIIRDNQTYIQLEAPYDEVNYYYEVPVNLSTYENNDALSFSADEYKEIRNLYRLQRNYIYDITVTIDRAGGSESDPVTLTNLRYAVKEFGEEEIDVPSFY